jgi:hypothetical protein
MSAIRNSSAPISAPEVRHPPQVRELSTNVRDLTTGANVPHLSNTVPLEGKNHPLPGVVQIDPIYGRR